MGTVCEMKQSKSGKQLVLELCTMENEKREIGTVQVYDCSKKNMFQTVKIGNYVRIYGKVQGTETPGNPGQFNEYEYLEQYEIYYKMFATECGIIEENVDVLPQALYSLRTIVSNHVIECMGEEEGGMMNAILFGDKSSLSDEMKLLYQRNGIAHLLAISGLHISILGMGLFALLRKFILPMRWAAAVTIVFLIFYDCLTGNSISTNRAVIMSICMLVARMIGRSYDAVSALSFSGICTCFLSSSSVFQAGFQLSYITVAGLLILVPIFSKGTKGWTETVIGSGIITLTTIPLVMVHYYEVPLYSIWINMLVIPLASLLVGAGLIGSLLLSLSKVLGTFFLGTSYFILKFYSVLCMFFQLLPFHRVVTGKPDFIQVVLFHIGLLGWAFVYHFEWNRKWKLCGLLMLVILCPKSREEFRFTMLDVGQGDCIYVESGELHMLVDGGSSDIKEVARYRIVPFLKHEGVDTLNYVWISHGDDDHTNAILEIIEHPEYGIHIDNVMLPKRNQNAKELYSIREACQKGGVAVHEVEKGTRYQTGEVETSILYPEADCKSEDENACSLVMSMDYKGSKILFTGDSPEEAEQGYLSELTTCDILKVAHHGSKNSTSDKFLELVSPGVSLISAGKNNRYGHPSQELVSRLQKVDSVICSTISQGAITGIWENYKIQIQSYK